MAAEAGIHTLDDLKRLGVVEVYQRVQAQQRGVSLNLLHGLQAAELNIGWHELPLAMREELRHAPHVGESGAGVSLNLRHGIRAGLPK